MLGKRARFDHAGYDDLGLSLEALAKFVDQPIHLLMVLGTLLLGQPQDVAAERVAPIRGEGKPRPGRNHLRAMRQMERVAADLQKSEPPMITDGLDKK